MTALPSTFRIPTILLVALLVNAIIFGVIQYMVGNPRLRLTEATEFDIANFIRVHEQSREVRSRRDPKAPEKPQQEQQQELRQLAQATSGSMAGLAVDIPDLDIDLGLDLGSNIQIARELIPLVRVNPDYPHRAALKGVEGYVVVRFTVTETGSVADPEVMRADPPGYFESAARRAILRWKYQPQIRDGKAVRVVSFTKLIFELEDMPTNR